MKTSVSQSIYVEIKQSLADAGRLCPEKEYQFVERYLGTKRKFLNVKSPERDKILCNIVKEIKDLDKQEIIKLLDDLILSDTFEYINFAGKLISKSPKARESVTFEILEKWLTPTTGWAECDSICQSLFSEKEVLEKWGEWQKTIMKFSQSKNIQLRRASLVLQVKPIRESTNENLAELAFETIEKLKGEKEVLITKAVSWLLRALAMQNKEEVRKYLENNKSTLPPIAFRETMRKIETGKK
jgi:3-methyladenine DNA glycosylase AlkD